MSNLITFVGDSDPFVRGLAEEGDRLGPVLSLLGVRVFERVILLSPAAARLQEMSAAIRERHPELDIAVHTLAVTPSLPYGTVLAEMQRSVETLMSDSPSCAWAVCLASGFPEIRAGWLWLAGQHFLPAELIDVRIPVLPDRQGTQISILSLEPEEESSGLQVREPTAAYRTRTRIQLNPSTPADQPTLEQACAQLGILGRHPRMLEVLEACRNVAEHRVPVLIQGETGTGKELVARLIHALSGRRPDRFIAVNCGALPGQLIESLLFGHRKGAFTGAASDQPGKFSLADGGTLFLDELGELPLELQPKLLRVLEDGRIQPLGAQREVPVDVRVVAATNQGLQEAVADGAFRKDLYYRLSYGVIPLPPLRERASDIPLIALAILADMNRSLRDPRQLSPAALDRLQTHAWKGNIRDLENVLGRSLLWSSTPVLGPEDLMLETLPTGSDAFAGLPDPAEGFSLEEYLGAVRRHLMLRALDKADGRQAGAARLLGISPQAVHKFVKGEQKGA